VQSRNAQGAWISRTPVGAAAKRLIMAVTDGKFRRGIYNEG
jgi:hypothetical protein